jgi:hypothetical protein
VSGLRINIDKTEAMCIGSLKTDKTISLFNIKWTNGPIKTLGITISNDLTEMLQNNFEPRILDVQNVLNIWFSRNLSLKGKVTILKSLILPKLLYVASVLPVPIDIMTVVDNMIIKFFWNNGSHKIKKDVLIQPIEVGGIKLPSFRDMVKTNRVSWVKRLLSPVNSKWKQIFIQAIHPLKCSEFFQSSIDKELIKSLENPFYQQIVHNWNEIKLKPTEPSEYLNETIWGNIFIKAKTRKGKSIIEKPIMWNCRLKNSIQNVGLTKYNHQTLF